MENSHRESLTYLSCDYPAQEHIENKTHMDGELKTLTVNRKQTAKSREEAIFLLVGGAI